MERARLKPIVGLDAYDHYLCGVSELHKFTPEANADALSNLYRAIELNPDFASAYGQAARCYAQRRGGGWVASRDRDVAEASRLARRAIELGKNDAVALSTAGYALSEVVDEAEDGGAYVDRALALNPNLAIAWLFSGAVKVSQGDPDAAMPRLLHAMRLSPQDLHMSTMQAAMATAYLVAGRYEEACPWAQMAVRGRPHKQLFVSALSAACDALAGRHEESRRMMAYVRETAPLLRLSNLKDFLSYHRPRDFDRWSEGLQKAGLPE
jgi:tetratricopeptide (TPR) repeat protein